MKKTVLSTALGFMTALTVSAQADTWKDGEPLPLNLQEVYSDTHRNMIYTAGGIPSDDANYTDAFRRYDPLKKTWEDLPPLPDRRHHITISATEETLYAIGGFTGSFPNWQAQNDVYIYHYKNNKWRNGTPLSVPRGEHVSVYVNGKIYVIGGRIRSKPDAMHFMGHHDSKLNEVFDPITNQWTEKAQAPTARNSASAGVIDGKIYVVGGRQNQVDANNAMRIVNLPHLEVYDPKTDTWESRAAMPEAQGGLAATTFKNKLYVFGGEQWYPTQKVSAKAWVYDPDTDKWRALPDMPTPRHGLSAATLKDEIHVFGGATINGLGAVNTHEILSFD